MTGETKILGNAINSIVVSLLNRDALLADFSRRDDLAGLENHVYYPLSLYRDLCEYLEQRLGMYAFLRVGRRIGAGVIATAFPPSVSSVEDALAQLDAAHQVFCRPVVGSIDLLHRAPGHLTIRDTSPYNCTVEEGVLYEMAIRYGAPQATVTHAQCRRKGADACHYEIRF